MIKKFKETIIKHNLIDKNDHVLVGLSGGADSVCLLSLLMSLKDSYNIKVSAAHFNHGVRGDEALRDELFSKKLAESFGVEFISGHGDMNGYAKKHGISKEAAGRTLRRKFLRESMDKLGANKLALAHNEDDQVETILMRIMRGTGTDGLRGIEIRSGYIIRPILNLKRIEIESYLNENAIEYVDDSTNFENEYHRNKIRNILLPELRSYNPNINSALLNLSKIAREDSLYLEEVSFEYFKKISFVMKDEIRVNISKLSALHKALKMRVIRS
ncbi:MAG: tRNA lysidine(34) synthetase TilS, partial [Gallicola sp.]|nr:tRNA lysidine(34) synthetase TilS [Gallicola sp.]